jgi:hypothetical protein
VKDEGAVTVCGFFYWSWLRDPAIVRGRYIRAKQTLPGWAALPEPWSDPPGC